LGYHPTLRDFKGDIKVSLRQKKMDLNTHPNTKGFLNDSFNNSHENKKTQYSKGSSNYVFGIVIAWDEKFNG
jgi:hypothetical protein